MKPDLIDRMFMEHEMQLAPGVRGVEFSELPPSTALIINWIRAEREGSGAVGRYLDSLPTVRTVKFIGVTNDRLAQMLSRRGFVERQVSMPFADGWMQAYVRKAAS